MSDEMMHKAWCCLGEVPYCFSRSFIKFQGHTAKKHWFWPNWAFWTVTPVWIHQRLWNDAQSLKQHNRRGALLFFKFVLQFSRSHRTKKITKLYPNWAFPDCNSSLNILMALKWCTKLNVVEVPYYFSRSSIKFQGHPGQQITNFDTNWVFPDCNSSLNKPIDLKWCAQSLT